MYENRSNRTHDSRNYQTWSNTYGSTDQRLDRIPSITHSVNGKVRYYSAIDAELYFGDIYVDEVTQITWSVQQQTLPLFGYNSHTFDDIAVGSRIIQGQFAINFTTRNFLTKLQNSSNFKQIARCKYSTDLGTSTIYSDYRRRLHLPVWDKGFDLVVGFGDTKSVGPNSIYATYTILDCVQITGSSLQLDYEGRPIQEIYSFIARDIKTAIAHTNEEVPSNSSIADTRANSNLEVDTSKSALNLIGSIDLTRTPQIMIKSLEEVTFNSGQLQFSGTFKNKILQSVLSLEPSVNRLELVHNMDSDFQYAFKSEFKDKSYILATIKYKYVHESKSDSNSKYEIEEEATINLTIIR